MYGLNPFALPLPKIIGPRHKRVFGTGDGGGTSSSSNKVDSNRKGAGDFISPLARIDTSVLSWITFFELDNGGDAVRC